MTGARSTSCWRRKAAASVSCRAGRLDSPIAEAIVDAAGEVVAGKRP
jgi:fumarate hydratase class II